MKIPILGIKINQINLGETIHQINKWTVSDDQHYIVTVNPEFIVATQKNKEFKNVLNLADIATCDGIGLVYAARFLLKKKLIRVTGVELTKKLLNYQLSNNNYQINSKFQKPNFKIYLLGGKNNSVKILRQKYPNKIVGAKMGGKIDMASWTLADNNEIINNINISGANILLVGFGQIKQEMWIFHNLDQLPNIKAAIGVGGTFDYLSGQVSRAPSWIRKIGLEWLFRLIREPKRFKRILNAVIIFPWLVIKNKIS